MADDIRQWLEKCKLGEYADAFAANRLELAHLSDLTEDDLRELGVTAMGDRKMLMRAIADLDGDGTAPTSSEPPSPLRQKSTVAERRQLTVMFCDMVGSTALSTRLDPEDYREVIRAYQDACAGVITRFDGYVAKYMGDGVLVYFGWPRGHEDDAQRAISAGLGVVEAVGDIVPADGETEALAVRIGVATGPVVVGDIVGEGASQEAAVTGETPNLAARLQEIAKPNTVVIAATTHALTVGLFAYETLGGQSLKGIEGSTEVWRVVGERRTESRFAATHSNELTPLVGREEELGLLSRRWEQARGGEGQVVLLSGEPGIGKSRLTRALQEAISDDPHTRLLLQCSPHHINSALYPVINQLEFAARFATGDDVDTRLAKLETFLTQSTQPVSDTVALMAALLSIPGGERFPLPRLTPQQLKDRTLASLIDHLADLTTEQPVLFVLEDAHWIDPTTLELMELTLERIRELPVLIVVTYRPEFSAPWIGEDHVTLLALNRLARKERARMAAALVGETAMSPEAFAQIAERSDGIPLFIEELTRSVREATAGPGITGNQGVAAGVDIPATLQDALEARFDRSPAVREVAQVGAAIGREFRYDLLAHVASMSTVELASALEDLAGSGLIFARGTPPDANYTFKHALIQDTAYESMVRSKRQDTHKRIVHALLTLRPEITETEPETLAHHYSEAGFFEEAIEWWTRAGQAASARSANPEAVALLERGLTLIDNLSESEARDRRELALQTALFGPLISVKGQYSSELEAATNRALALCDNVDAPEEMFRGLFAKSVAHGMRGQHQLSNETANELVQKAERASDEAASLVGQRMVAMSLFLLGRVLEAQDHIDIVISTFDRERHGHVMVTYGQDPAAISEAYNALFQWVLGWPDKSRAASERAISQALELDHVGTLGPVLSWGGQIASAIRRDADGLRRTCGHLRALTSHHKMPIWETVEQLANAELESMEKPSRQTATELHGLFEHFESLTRNCMFFPFYWAGLLAENYLAIGDPEKALDAIERGFKFAEDSDEHWSDAELLRMRGEALALRDGAVGNDEAEVWMRRAIDDAQKHKAKSFELRAAMSLARLLRDQGHAREAHEILSPTYGWFTEGFDTPDLKNAKALLDELS